MFKQHFKPDGVPVMSSISNTCAEREFTSRATSAVNARSHPWCETTIAGPALLLPVSHHCSHPLSRNPSKTPSTPRAALRGALTLPPKTPFGYPQALTHFKARWTIHHCNSVRKNVRTTTFICSSIRINLRSSRTFQDH